MDYEVSKSTGRIPLLFISSADNRLNLNFNGLFSYIGFMVALFMLASFFGK
ncbi:hypothetical protein WUBG_16359, partial [Wuchereria bancrofti]